jgi:hypothetical protein
VRLIQKEARANFLYFINGLAHNTPVTNKHTIANHSISERVQNCAVAIVDTMTTGYSSTFSNLFGNTATYFFPTIDKISG